MAGGKILSMYDDNRERLERFLRIEVQTRLSKSEERKTRVFFRQCRDVFPFIPNPDRIAVNCVRPVATRKKPQSSGFGRLTCRSRSQFTRRERVCSSTGD